MTARPSFKLSRLRRIGSRRWHSGGPGGREGVPSDELDFYLLQAAGQLWNGACPDEVTDYLVSVKSGPAGPDSAPGLRRRTHEVVSALADYVSELRG